VQVWVPDTRAAGFAAEVRRQCERANNADRAERLMEWVEQVGIFDEDDPR
jgi:DNA gyrase inhibitor GyrI